MSDKRHLAILVLLVLLCACEIVLAQQRDVLVDADGKEKASVSSDGERAEQPDASHSSDRKKTEQPDASESSDGKKSEQPDASESSDSKKSEQPFKSVDKANMRQETSPEVYDQVIKQPEASWIWAYSKYLFVLFISVLLSLGYKNFVKWSKSPAEHLSDGNRFKLSKQWREAAEAFESAALQFKQQGPGGEHDAASNFAEAANCFRKLGQTDFKKKAVQCLQRAADMFAEQGHFSIAARYLEDAGDLASSASADDSDLRFAIQLYLRAADIWSGEDSPANAAGSRTKAAELMADCGRLSEAAGLFEQLGESAQSHELLRFGVKELMLKSCLCLLCSGEPGLIEKAQQLARSCDSFANSDELSLVTELSAAADALDVAVLDTAVEKFGRFNNIDAFARGRLDQLRKKVSGEAVPLQ